MHTSSSSLVPSFKITLDAAATCCRIDLFLTQIYTDSSRTFFQKAIEKKLVMVNNKLVTKPHYMLKIGDTIEYSPAERTIGTYAPSDIAYDIKTMLVAETADFLIINKPAGLVVHRPHEKNTDISLVDIALDYFPALASVGEVERPGIVHRLDKDTSGLIIIAKNIATYETLMALFKNRLVDKTYYAVVQGQLPASGSIDYAISRHLVIPNKMTHIDSHGRASLTHYKSVTYFTDATLLELKPTTGRTHQLRVHCAAIGHPILGDFLYGSASKQIRRQALHAGALSFTLHGQEYSYAIDLPEDFKELLDTKIPIKAESN